MQEQRANMFNHFNGSENESGAVGTYIFNNYILVHVVSATNNMTVLIENQGNECSF